MDYSIICSYIYIQRLYYTTSQKSHMWRNTRFYDDNKTKRCSNNLHPKNNQEAWVWLDIKWSTPPRNDKKKLPHWSKRWRFLQLKRKAVSSNKKNLPISFSNPKRNNARLTDIVMNTAASNQRRTKLYNISKKKKKSKGNIRLWAPIITWVKLIWCMPCIITIGFHKK